MDRSVTPTTFSVDSPPSESWLFAQALLGKPIPDPRAAANYQRQQRERLEWLAHLSRRHAEQLRQLKNAENEARRKRVSLEWAASISPAAEDKLHKLLRDEAQTLQALKIWERYYESYLASLTEWNPDQPRYEKGTHLGGRWRPQDGGAGGASSAAAMPQAAQRSATPEPDRVFNSIRARSGDDWSGDRVLDAIATIAPGWLPFVKRYVTLALTSDGANEASTTVRQGEFGPALGDLPDAPLRKLGALSVHFEIPANWNDIQVAKHIVAQLADDIDVHRLAADWSASHPELFKGIQAQRFKDGLSTIAALAGGYYSAIASLLPGGQAAVAGWDIQSGDKLGAALDIAFMLPLGKIAKAGVEAAGSIALKAGDKLVGILPVKTIEQIGKLTPDQKALLHTRLLAAKNEQEAAEIVEAFLALKFDRHHPLPKFLGGDVEQLLAKVPTDIHQEFHDVLREELKAAGLNLPIGGRNGSSQAWAEYLSKDAARQGIAFDAVLKASRAIDAKHGTSITDSVWKNLVGQNFMLFPKAKVK